MSHSEIDESACPRCGCKRVHEIIYGMPSAFDAHKLKARRAVLGGPCYYAGMPTHFCASCRSAWCVTGFEPEEYKPSEVCHFCGTFLSPAEVLRNETARDEFYESVFAPDNRRPVIEWNGIEPFPFPRCDRCRKALDEFQEELERQEEEDAEQTRIAGIVMRIGCVVFMAALAICFLVIWWLERA